MLFRGSITKDQIVQFKELVKDETVDINAIVTTQVGEEMSPIHFLCRYYNIYNLIDLLKDLLANGADVNTRARVKLNPNFPVTGLTPLHLLFWFRANYSVTGDNLIIFNAVQLLLENGADVNARKGEDGDTPLHYLCRWYENEDQFINMAQLLIERGAEVNAETNWGETALLFLCSRYQKDNLLDIAKFLIQKGANANAKNKYRWTPLYYVCVNYTKDNLRDIVQLFIENGADVNVEDVYGSTPLHNLAYFYKNDNPTKERYLLKSIVRLFLKQGANIYGKNVNGDTPFELLRRRGLYVKNNTV